ncbi:MAG: M48 family peptidase [Chloroflexi bacterium HGW-Chloroflexi-2]|jgi:hypothetical protein|nr:MAG: M48 family peptidase [Chloroflexi bacterium HGW-Chloroflexi-2]
MGAIKIDEVVRSRRKTIALVVQPDGRLVVRAPLRVSQKIIDAFVISKADWIEKSRQSQVARRKFFPKRSFASGELFWYLGKQYPIKVVKSQRPVFQFQLGFSLDENALPQAKKQFEKWYRDQARLYLNERVVHYARLYNFHYQKIRVSSARTRWGSCSARGTLSFTWRLIMSPPEIIDYVVIHELAHTIHHNHSPQFWGLVGSILPDYAEKRKWLKHNSHLFHWD